MIIYYLSYALSYFKLLFCSRLSWIFLVEALSNMKDYSDMFTSGPEVHFQIFVFGAHVIFICC